jgi:hypothetical protein
MDGVTSSSALGTLRHPDHSVAPVSPVGLTVVWAEAERVRSAAEAIEMSLSWGMPGLYTGPAGGTKLDPSFLFIRVTGEADTIEDSTLLELVARLEEVREAVPAHIADLTQMIGETAAATRAAEQRREALKDVLRRNAPALSGVPEARTIVGLQRRIAQLELDRRGRTGIDVTAVRAAYECLLELQVTELPVDPEAERLAAAWERLLNDEASLDRTEPRHPLTDQLLTMQGKLREAALALSSAKADVDRPRPTNAERAEIDRLHAITEEAEEGSGRFSGRRGGQAVDEALARENAYLERFGFDSYADYIISGAIDPPIAAFARLQVAEQKVAAVNAMIGDLQASMAPSRARQELLAQTDRLAAEIAARFGSIEATEDVAAMLRGVRRPPREWFELAEALQAHGEEATEDPMTVAYDVLRRAQEQNGPLEAIEAEVAAARTALASIDQPVLAEFGPLGVAAAELVHVEQAYTRLVADLAELRAYIAGQLERDPAVLAKLDLIQTLDRELSELSRRLAAEGGDQDGSGGGTRAAEALDAALSAALAEPAGAGSQPAVVVFEVAVDDSAATAAADLAACVELLAASAAGRQVIVMTSLRALVEAARNYDGVSLSTFATYELQR